MSDDLPADIASVVDFFGLPDAAVVEKDWYVVKALTAIAEVDASPLRLVFGGGTALARAHKLIRRMSEDIDIKIVADRPPSRAALRRLREAVTDALLRAGFQFDPNNPAHRRSGNESRYTIFQLPYEPRTAAKGILRPEIQIELGVWPLRRPAIDLPMFSFVAEALKRNPEISAIACVSITQTAAEKFVALTRRVAAELNLAENERDHTLIRHIYDLHVTHRHYDMAEVAALALDIMPHDAEVFGNQAPDYRADPLGQTLRAIQALENDPSYARQYAEFTGMMVYGDTVAYAACISTLRNLAGSLPKNNG